MHQGNWLEESTRCRCTSINYIELNVIFLHVSLLTLRQNMLCLFVFLSLSIQISTAHGSRGCCGSTRRLAKLNVNPRRWTTWTSKMSCLDPNHSARVRFQTCGNSACGLGVMDCGSGGLQTGWVTMVQPGNWDLSGLKACPRIKPLSSQQLPFLRQKLLIAGYMAPGLTTQSVKSILFGKDMAGTRANLCEVLQTVKKLVNAHVTMTQLDCIS